MFKINKSNLIIILATIVAVAAIFFAIKYSGEESLFPSYGYTSNTAEENINNVYIVDGKQIVEIKAKGGYRPEHSTAKAGIPTILRLDTSGTFDCTSIVRIPSMNINQNLPMTGITDINLGVQGISTLQGTCGTGTYPFDIKFE